MVTTQVEKTSVMDAPTTVEVNNTTSSTASEALVIIIVQATGAGISLVMAICLINGFIIFYKRRKRKNVKEGNDDSPTEEYDTTSGSSTTSLEEKNTTPLKVEPTQPNSTPPLTTQSTKAEVSTHRAKLASLVESHNAAMSERLKRTSLWADQARRYSTAKKDSTTLTKTKSDHTDHTDPDRSSSSSEASLRLSSTPDSCQEEMTMKEEMKAHPASHPIQPTTSTPTSTPYYIPVQNPNFLQVARPRPPRKRSVTVGPIQTRNAVLSSGVERSQSTSPPSSTVPKPTPSSEFQALMAYSAKKTNKRQGQPTRERHLEPKQDQDNNAISPEWERNSQTTFSVETRKSTSQEQDRAKKDSLSSSVETTSQERRKSSTSQEISAASRGTRDSRSSSQSSSPSAKEESSLSTDRRNLTSSIQERDRAGFSSQKRESFLKEEGDLSHDTDSP